MAPAQMDGMYAVPSNADTDAEALAGAAWRLYAEAASVTRPADLNRQLRHFQRSRLTTAGAGKRPRHAFWVMWSPARRRRIGSHQELEEQRVAPASCSCWSGFWKGAAAGGPEPGRPG